jgi:hypothetical protein
MGDEMKYLQRGAVLHLNFAVAEGDHRVFEERFAC